MSLSNDYKYLNQQEISCKNSINHKKELLFQSAFTWNMLKKNLRRKIHSNIFQQKYWGHNFNCVCTFYKMEMKLNVSSFDKNHSMSTSGSNTRALFCVLCSQIVVHSSILLNWNSVDKRWGAVGWFQKLCCIYLIYICRLFSFRSYFQKISSVIISYRLLKFMFSKKATKIYKIFTGDLTLT